MHKSWTWIVWYYVEDGKWEDYEPDYRYQKKRRNLTIRSKIVHGKKRVVNPLDELEATGVDRHVSKMDGSHIQAPFTSRTWKLTQTLSSNTHKATDTSFPAITHKEKDLIHEPHERERWDNAIDQSYSNTEQRVLKHATNVLIDDSSERSANSINSSQIACGEGAVGEQRLVLIRNVRLWVSWRWMDIG